MPDGTATAHLYRPKLMTTFSEGYRAHHARADLVAGLIVAIVALPLSMAIAVASGVSPERGIYAAIIGGALVSAFGGSRYQIGGPAGAFIVLVAETVRSFGIDGLILTVLLSGILLTLLGALRVGSLIRHIPHPVTVGFTAGIALTILGSQIKDFAGLTLMEPEPSELLPKLTVLSSSFGTLRPEAVALGVGVVTVIFFLKRFRPNWPGMLIAVVAATAFAAFVNLSVETIGTRFGELPHALLMPRLPDVSWHLLRELLPAVVSFTLLGGIESLLSAKVADSMSGRRHRSNMELVAQGIANIGSACFGGISVTGTIARTATNIRAGAHSPLAGIFHSAFLLAFLLVASPLARFVPLSVLAGVLVVVCWNMIEKAEFLRLLGDWRNAAVLLTTFGGTLLSSLTTGIVAGSLAAATLAIFGRRVRSDEERSNKD